MSEEFDKNKYVVKRCFWFGWVKKVNRESTFSSYLGKPKLMVIGIEKNGWD